MGVPGTGAKLVVFAVLLAGLAACQSDPVDPCKGQEQIMTVVTEAEVLAVMDKYQDRILAYPKVVGFGPYIIPDEDGNPTDQYGLEIAVTERVPASLVPEDLRIPDCLEGIPVSWEVEDEARLHTEEEQD